MSEGPTDLATAFKHTREQRQLSRIAASTAAQIPAHYLAVLEGEGEKHWLADPLYLVPFIRTYATFLDLNAEAAVAQFLSTLRQKEVEGIVPTVSIHARQTRFPFGPVMLVSGLVVAIALLFFIWHQQAQDTTSSQISGLPPESVSEEDSLQSVSPPSSPTQEVTSQTPPPASVPASASSPARAVSSPLVPSPPLAAALPVSQQEEPAIQGKHSLQVRATQEVWLRVVVDDQQTTQALLQPGDGRTWHAQEGFTVTVGNAGGVEFTLDNQPIPPLGISGQVVRDVRLPAS